MIFVTSCTRNIQSPNSADLSVCPCEIIRGRASDWNVISDDLARNIYQHNTICEKLDANYSL